jgi:hypothetical protein
MTNDDMKELLSSRATFGPKPPRKRALKNAAMKLRFWWALFAAMKSATVTSRRFVEVAVQDKLFAEVKSADEFAGLSREEFVENLLYIREVLRLGSGGRVECKYRTGRKPSLDQTERRMR